LDDLWRLWKGRCRARNEVSAGLPGRWRVMRIKSLSAALCGVAMVGALALPASAADAETGYRYASACTVGSETRPAVTWRAMGEMEITPPGAGYIVDDSSPLQYITRTT